MHKIVFGRYRMKPDGCVMIDIRSTIHPITFSPYPINVECSNAQDFETWPLSVKTLRSRDSCNDYTSMLFRQSNVRSRWYDRGMAQQPRRV